jgi:hypothetical protein
MNFDQRAMLLGSLGVLTILVLFFSLFYSSPAHSSRSSRGDTLVVIGMDAARRPTAQAVPLPEYVRFLSGSLGVVSDSFSPAITTKAQEASGTWQLNSIGVGLGLTGQIGLGPIFYISVTPQLRLVFSDSKNPVYPN